MILVSPQQQTHSLAQTCDDHIIQYIHVHVVYMYPASSRTITCTMYIHAGHPDLVFLCLRVCTVWVCELGLGFLSVFSCTLYMYIHVHVHH